MPRIILYIASSLDGKIEGADGDLTWLKDDDYDYAGFIASIETVVMGRKTLDFVEAHGEWPYPEQDALVFSRTKRTSIFPQVRFAKGDVAEELRKLKASASKDIWLIGGGEIIAPAMEANLIDEIQLFLHPTILSSGTPLVPAGFSRRDWELTKTKPYPCGVVELRYAQSNAE